MTHENLPKSIAYDKARKEFYHYRHLEEVERRVAKEEALSTGAYFGKSVLEVGMELENSAYEDWKVWAAQQIQEAKQQASAMYSGPAEEGMADDSFGASEGSEETTEGA
jgi:small subunit ribosomal protein S23